MVNTVNDPLHSMSDDEYGQHLDYDQGYYDGNYGNPRRTEGFHRSQKHYDDGYEKGRLHLVDSFDRMLTHAVREECELFLGGFELDLIVIWTTDDPALVELAHLNAQMGKVDETTGEMLALCGLNYLRSELEHYTTGDYDGSGSPSELKLLEVARKFEQLGYRWLLLKTG